MDGEIISHAHPYDKSHDTQPFKNHKHTSAELFFLDQIQLLFAGFSCLLVLPLVFNKIIDRIEMIRLPFRVSAGLPVTRPPPAPVG